MLSQINRNPTKTCRTHGARLGGAYSVRYKATGHLRLEEKILKMPEI
jgi:hypothetical protein